MEITRCPICDSSNKKQTLFCNDYLVTNEKFSICECKQCGFKFTSPRPEDDNLWKYYESEDYISHSETKKGLVNGLYILARKYTLKWKIDLIKTLTTKRKLLDLGCGSGSFLNACKERGFNVTGMEPSDFARERASKEYGLDILPIEDIYTCDEKKDIVTMWHVLEHVADLNGYFERLRKILNDDGVLLIALPNNNSYDAKHYEAYWAAYDVPRHLWHFNRKSVKELGEKHGFELKHIIPMKLDAFYIAMLSEKYIHGKNRMIKAFFVGLISNIHALFNGREYSSLIYVLKKK